MTPARVLPQCWGHRGASAVYPENTLASFEAAMRDGAEGIESDVHVSADGVVVMFHDPALDRTTGSKGLIRERNWHGEDGMEHLRTIKEPRQAIPTFAETIALLIKPENQHVNFNVDVKVQNDPDRLFQLMHTVIAEQPEWETKLAPRILLGLWHPRFVAYAKARLPYCRRSHIGVSTSLARKYFWDDVDVFSMAFASLAGIDGWRFRNDCKAAGKKIMVWTVNEPEHMMECVRWGADVVLTDVTKKWLELRGALLVDYDAILSRYGRWFLWTTWKFYLPNIMAHRVSKYHLESVAGPFDKFVRPESMVVKTVAA
ncbi:PLC-like phosphodiesterase [Gyrodon lividus]|nr:PLC-like phosphodiesterase [Gyrodon lividus]